MPRQAKVIITSTNNAGAGIKAAVKDLVSLESNATRVAQGIQNALSATAVIALGKKMVDFGIDSVKAFGDVERSTAQLRTALGGSSDALARMNGVIEDLSSKSLASKGDIRDLVADLASLGHSEDDINRIATAAVNLANVTGQGLKEAMKQVNSTFSGSTDELGKLIPEIKGLTKEQLAAGGAADVITSKFENLSREMSEGVSQRLKLLSESFGDLRENIGERLLTAFSPMLTFLQQVVNGWNDAYAAQKKYQEALNSNDPEMAAALKRVSDIKKEISKLEQMIASGAAELQGLGAADLEALNRAYAGALRALKELENKRSGLSGITPATSTTPSVSGSTDTLSSPGVDLGVPFPGGASDTTKTNAGYGYYGWVPPAEDSGGGGSAGKLAALFEKLGTAIDGAIDGFMSWFNALQPVIDILDPIKTILSGMFEVLGPLIEELLAPISDMLKIFGNIMAKSLIPILNILTPVFNLLAKVMLFFANKIMIPVANFIIGIWNGIAKVINKLLGWAGVKLKYADKIDPVGLGETTDDGTGDNTSPSSPGRGASYTGSQPITFNFYNNGNVIGSGGLEELAMLIDSIIKRNERYA